MAKKSKQLEVQARYIYNPEIEVCAHCGERLRARPYYEWRKTVQQLNGAVLVISQARVCGNPNCDHQQEVYKSVAAQMVTLPKCTYGLDLSGLPCGKQAQGSQKGYFSGKKTRRVAS